MRSVCLNLFLFFFSISSADCRLPKRYHVLRHTGGAAAVPYAMSGHKQFIFLTESLRLHREQVCDKQELRLKCPPHTKIMVETVFYGRLVPSSELCPKTTSQQHKNGTKGSKKKGKTSLARQQDQRFEDTSCDVSNAYSKITEKCQNKDECKFRVNAQFFDRDPCPETSKYLQVAYKCRPSQFMSDNYCEGSRVELTCRRESQRLAVYSATYGRSAINTVAGCGEGTVLNNDCVVDVLHRVMQVCHAQNSCAFTVSEEYLHISNSPCDVGVLKYLNIVHMCVDETIFSVKSIVGNSMNSDENDRFQSATTTSVVETSTTAELLLEPTTTVDDFDFFQTVSGQSSMNDGRSSSAAIAPSGGRRTPEIDTRFNDSLIDSQVLFESKCSMASSMPTTTSRAPILCIPPHLPNAFGFVVDFMVTWQYLKDNKEKLILYFCLSSSAGFIIILVFCIVQQCYRTNATARQQRRRQTDTKDVSSKEVDYMSLTSPIVFDNDSRMEMTDFGRDGVSFMRFNHPTPPRTGSGPAVLPSPSAHFYNS